MGGAGGIFLRNGRWYYRVKVGGRLVRESLAKYGVTTEAQAKAYLRQMEKAQLEGRLAMLDPSAKTLGQFVAEYIEHRQGLALSPHTKTQDAKALRSLMSVLGEACRLQAINQKQVDRWVKALLDKGRSVRTVNSYLTHISAALNTAVEWELLDKRPKIKKPRPPARLPRSLTPKDVDRLLAAEDNPERRALWRFFLWTGCRRQEALDIQWRDLFLDGAAPWVRVVGKGDKERSVPLMPGAIQAIKAMPQADVGHVWTFTRRNYNGRIRPTGDAVSHWFKLTARKAGVEAHLHDLRHTAATWMLARGVRLRIVQEVLGHSSYRVTEVYTKGLAGMVDLHAELAKGLGIAKMTQ